MRMSCPAGGLLASFSCFALPLGEEAAAFLAGDFLAGEGILLTSANTVCAALLLCMGLASCCCVIKSCCVICLAPKPRIRRHEVLATALVLRNETTNIQILDHANGSVASVAQAFVNCPIRERAARCGRRVLLRRGGASMRRDAVLPRMDPPPTPSAHPRDTQPDNAYNFNTSWGRNYTQRGGDG